MARYPGMRQPRLLVPHDAPVGHYHCTSRIVDKQRIFGPLEKRHFIALMRELEVFCGVQILTFCVMSNHFHILLAVPRRPPILPSAEEILSKLKGLTCHLDLDRHRAELAGLRQRGDVEGERAWLEKFYRRMWSLSAYMKALKQRFTQWYNHRMEREGTLWEGRFKSVLVEGVGHVLAIMAAYIDLNPIRAGIVVDPKDYEASGYGEAVRGHAPAKAGLAEVVRALDAGREVGPEEVMARYRVHLYLEGSEERESTGEDGKAVRGALSREAVAKVLAEKGRLTVGDYLRCRVRYFRDGVVLGGKAFVESIFQANRGRFGPKRKSGARRLRGVEDLKEGPLFCLRDLRKRVIE